MLVNWSSDFKRQSWGLPLSEKIIKTGSGSLNPETNSRSIINHAVFAQVYITWYWPFRWGRLRGRRCATKWRNQNLGMKYREAYNTKVSVLYLIVFQSWVKPTLLVRFNGKDYMHHHNPWSGHIYIVSNRYFNVPLNEKR